MKVSELEIGRYYAKTTTIGERRSRRKRRHVRKITRIVFLPYDATRPYQIDYEVIGRTGGGLVYAKTFAAWAQEDVTNEFRKREGHGGEA